MTKPRGERVLTETEKEAIALAFMVRSKGYEDPKVARWVLKCAGLLSALETALTEE